MREMKRKHHTCQIYYEYILTPLGGETYSPVWASLNYNGASSQLTEFVRVGTAVPKVGCAKLVKMDDRIARFFIPIYGILAALWKTE